ncbi:LamG-like jellyroll fold domain-containing protein [Lepagella muris]|jgi:hypothetical protein|uniref:Ricin-type beta-trefoil lectin domain protein n=1 Tax=Lepagella muris TaxID=3032870 RepID=A0AC61RE21_9BACT|nr:LamG-like jellyroll fold domain-containing protein [Lepagella muris]ROT07673.1 ricin-type beta-trefoil lectin domain protein [Muribaculaceae bacterium Isolate-037 (Harlan)]TGY78879.1 ricin-type beta-trefoil lectin domain protein [Lepagella muris]THG52319.1 ricin-type beta-trefoil lectin domain protein [Bacteroidales bacterium]TKC57946.1 ricin-type beta-trefoil lectin domain protein [Bacteroidales bacterium]
MRQNLLFILGALSAMPGAAATDIPDGWSLYDLIPPADRVLLFDYDAEGKKLPILWGFDTAWNDYGNMLRGVRYSRGADVGVARVSFQPWAKIEEKGKLPPMLQENLEKRLANVALNERRVDIALNLDGGENTVKAIYGGLDGANNYVGDPDAAAEEYALLIDATAAAVEEAGYRVVSAAPFNEPDYFWNGTPINVFDKINRRLKDFDAYPRFRDIRISGGNTLNCDQAMPWYSELKEYLDEGNTHQLAGDFDHYADFFATVRADGKYATADELHNVMEAMVGVEYGMQTGIWWGSAEQARGEFMKASAGERLGYAENRKAWSAASVYRAPSGRVQAFLGCSERQARPSTYKLVSRNGDVYVDGFGPVREYVASLPGDPNGGYQTDQQRNAETVLNITRGADIQPAIDGAYILVNAASHMVISGKDGNTNNANDIVQRSYTGGADQHWAFRHVPETQGGDFSYFFITNYGTSQALDDNNWNIEVGGKVISYGLSGAGVQQWALEYDGDGWFHIRNKQSALYLECDGGENAPALQQERTDNANQRWRLIPMGSPVEFDAPSAPTGLTAAGRNASVMLEWDEMADEVTYMVLRAEAGTDDFNTIARGLKSTAYLDNTVTPGVAYDYKLVAEDASCNRSVPSASVEGETVGNGMTAWFPLDNSMDELAANGWSMRTHEDPSFRAGYKDGIKALFFRKTQYAQLPYSAFSGDSFSLALWTRIGAASEGDYLFSTGVSEDETLYLTPRTEGEMRLVAVNGDVTRQIAVPAIQDWNHVAIVVDGGDVKLYLNGECVGSDDFSDAMPQCRLLSYLGRGHGLKDTYLTGYVGDLRIFNHAITPETVKETMTGEYSGVSQIVDDAEVVAVEYYSPQGIRLDAPAPVGITIVRTIYSDGRVVTRKVIADRN